MSFTDKARICLKFLVFDEAYTESQAGQNIRHAVLLWFTHPTPETALSIIDLRAALPEQPAHTTKLSYYNTNRRKFVGACLLYALLDWLAPHDYTDLLQLALDAYFDGIPLAQITLRQVSLFAYYDDETMYTMATAEKVNEMTDEQFAAATANKDCFTFMDEMTK